MRGGTGNSVLRQLPQSVRPPTLPAEPPNPFDMVAVRAFPKASCQIGALDHSISQLHRSQIGRQPAATAMDVYSPPNSAGSLLYGSGGPERHLDEWLTQHSQLVEQAPSSTWGTDSAEAFPEVAHADMLGPSPRSRHSGSLATMEESLTSASALQPHAATFAQLLQQQEERAALGSAGPSGALGRLSASQLANALSALPQLSDIERMARFMAALQESRPRGAPAPAARSNASVLPSIQSQQLLHGLSEMCGTQDSPQGVSTSHPHLATRGLSHGSSSGENFRSSYNA